MENKIQAKFQDQFLDEMLAEAGFEDTDAIDLLKEDLQPLLQERIMMHIYQALNEDQVNQVSKFLEENKTTELDAYLADTIPDYEDFLMEIYAQFEDEYLENMKK